jgi:class 3 adenylate cyclase
MLSRNAVHPDATQALLHALTTGKAAKNTSRVARMTTRVGLWLHRLDQRLSRPEDTLAQRMRIVAFFVACPSLAMSNLALASLLLACDKALMGGVAMLVVLVQLAIIVMVFFRCMRAEVGSLLILVMMQLHPTAIHMIIGSFTGTSAGLTWSAISAPLAGVLLHSRPAMFGFTASGLFVCIVATIVGEVTHDQWLTLRTAQQLEGHLRTSVFAINVLLPVLMMVLAILYYDVRFAGEQSNSDELLYRIMPRNTAAQLKSGVPRRALVERYDSVTCFFADIVGYTSLASMHTAGETIAILDRLYEKMDAVALRFGVYKVATIGDAYFAVAGCPLASSAQIDAIKMAQFALAVRDSLATEIGVRVRIGLHSGPVVAGVIGELAPQFTLVGDTVTTTSLVESHGQAGRIHCSQSTYELLCDRFEFGTRTPMRLKGSRHAKTQTYWLLGVNDDRGPRRPLTARRAAKRRLSESAPVQCEGFDFDEPDDEFARRLSVSLSVPSSASATSLAGSMVSPRRRSLLLSSKGQTDE